MRSSDMLALVTDKDGNLLTDVKEVAKALETMKKREKAEGVKRRTEAARRKQFGKVGVNGKLSYDSMTAYVWEFSMSRVDEMRQWMMYEYPNLFEIVPGEIPGEAQETEYEGVDAG